ncbi:MAG: ATP-dependent Clp protease proteolytic subunit [Pseudonocardia sp.]|nr:ATP-dependent Clp protease proteolytic subunit [Pseudonocardia sp.]
MHHPPHQLTQSVTVLTDHPDATTEYLLDARVVMIGGEVDDATAHRVVAQLLLLAARDPRRDITLYVHSPGGSPVAALAILDTMQLIAPDVATCAVGVAVSAGQLLVTAGAPGKRSALRHARLRMGSAAVGLGDAAVREQLRREIAEVTARRSGRAQERVLADGGRWFSAVESRGHGLVDVVAG